MTNVKLAPTQESYLQAEFDKLKEEIEKIVDETRVRERYSLTIIAAVATWLFTNAKPENNLLVVISLIPVITTTLYIYSVQSLYKTILWRAEYLEKIENYFFPDNINGFGWERYFNNPGRKGYAIKSVTYIWIFQLALSIILFLIVLMKKCVCLM